MKLTEEELRKKIRQQLNELHGGGWGDDAGTYSTSGVDGLKKIFIEPFTDVLKTTAAGVETVSSQAQRLLASASALVVNTFIPFVDLDWKKIRQSDARRMAAIQNKYKDVFDRTHSALFEGDGKAISFLWDPSGFLTARAFLKSPTAFVSILRLLAGQNPKILEKIDKLDRVTSKLERKKNESVDRGNIMLTENGLFAAAIQYVENSGLIDDVMSLPIIDEMRSDANELLEDHVDEIYDSYKSMQEYIPVERLNQISNGKLIQQLDKAEDGKQEALRKEIEDLASNMIKKTYLEKLKQELTNLPKEFQEKYKILFDQIKKS